MADLAKSLREEISRLAKREIRAQTGATKQAVSQYRRDIAKLKREIREQQKKISFLEKQEQKRLEQQPTTSVLSDNVRFSAKSVRSQRKRLGLSAADYAKLVGVTPLSVYNWEHGKSRPRNEQLAALVALRGIGKREAMARLEMLAEREAAAAATTPKKKARKKTKS